jgi:hypothetical protein
VSSTRAANSPKRELAVAVILAAAGGALALFASSRTWAVIDTPRPPPLPTAHEEITGRDAVPWASAVSFVALAGGLALLAVRRVARALIGGALVLTGLVEVTGGFTGWLTAGSAFETVQTRAAWPAAFVAAGIIVLLSGGVVLLRGPQWSTAGARYDGDRPPTDAGLWDALDRGEDPTV